FGKESAAILGAVHEWRLSDALRLVDDLPWAHRYDMLSDAVALLGTPPSVLIDEALERARAQTEATLRAAEAA
ncbi:hypothetical protein, partial [Nocardiopsis halophila]|uniref:hypothetical protein n=1 Tax=Nocardiopsis halophila TaxID=141692 RepID=UPI0005843CC8